MYSQIFEGISNEFTDEKIIQAMTTNQEGMPFLPAKNETGTINMSHRTEIGILHDHIYNRLEDKLHPSILEASNIKNEDLIDTLQGNAIIKISGRAEIEDYQKLKSILKDYNDIAKIIAYSTKISKENHKEKVIDLLARIDTASNAGTKKQLRTELEKLYNSTAEAKESGLLQDEHLLENLIHFIDRFNPAGYEVAISSNDGEITYRGIINREWLRIDPRLVSSMYGGQSESPWSMVGIVTHIQGTYNIQEQITSEVNPDNPMFLDNYRDMIRKSRFFERMFLESNSKQEIVMHPIAIYRDFSLQVED